MKILLTIVIVHCGTLAIRAEGYRQALLLTDGPMVEATLEMAEQNGILQFRVVNDLRRITRENLVRWSTPSMATATNELILVDGSRLMLAEPWAGEPSLKIEAQEVSATTKRLGKITFPRTKLRAVLFNAPIYVQQRTKFVDHLLASRSSGDVLMLANQDLLNGKLLSIVSASRTEYDNQPGATIIFETEIGKLKFPQTRVAGIIGNPGQGDSSSGALAVGLRDGSYLVARSLVADAQRLRVELACGIELSGADRRDVVHVQSLAGRLAYLSDSKAADYQHEPYLDIGWPYRSDRSVLGGPLVVGRRTYAKGLGMHSTSRLTYSLEANHKKAHYKRFAAEVAIDDAAAGHGSVIFRVYLLQKKVWQLAYTSPTVRGGDAPHTMSLELKDAQQIALATDYADHGDERDYANWLDARLEE